MRLFSVPVVLAALLVFSPARSQAQYTTKTTSSKSSGYTTKRQAAPAKTEEKAAGTPSRKTSRADLFKPRNRPVEDTGEEDLPSFEAMNSPQRQSSGTQSAPKNEGGNAYFQMRQRLKAAQQGSAQGSMQNQGSDQGSFQVQGSNVVAPPPMPKGEIWFYVTDFSTEKVGKFTICSYKTVLQNKTNTKLDRLEVQLQWPVRTITVEYRGIEAKGNQVKGATTYVKGCEMMSAKPRTTIKACRIGAAVNENCEKLIVFK